MWSRDFADMIVCWSSYGQIRIIRKEEEQRHPRGLWIFARFSGLRLCVFTLATNFCTAFFMWEPPHCAAGTHSAFWPGKTNFSTGMHSAGRALDRKVPITQLWWKRHGKVGSLKRRPARVGVNIKGDPKSETARQGPEKTGSTRGSAWQKNKTCKFKDGINMERALFHFT